MARDKISFAAAVRVGRSGCLGGQRGGASGLSHRNDPRRQRRQGPHFNPPITHALFWISHAVLFHPGRIVRFSAGLDRRAGRIPADACR